MRKYLSCCSIWVLFEEAIQKQKVSYAVLYKARTVFGQNFSCKEQPSTRHDTAARTGRPTIYWQRRPGFRIGSRKTRTTIGMYSQAQWCRNTSAYVDVPKLLGVDFTRCLVYRHYILRNKHWLQRCLKCCAENIKKFFFFFFSSYRPKTCLHQCVSPSFHWSSSVSLPNGNSVMYFVHSSLIDLPPFAICAAPFRSSSLYPRRYVLDLAYFPYSFVSYLVYPCFS
jgi:hypothetical protein